MQNNIIKLNPFSIRKVATFVCLLLLSAACAKSDGSGGGSVDDLVGKEGVVDPGPTTDPEQALKPKTEALAWETLAAPERKQWSAYTFEVVTKVFDSLDQAQDANLFCPRYAKLSKTQKINFWGQLIAGMAYYESGWKPTSRMQESTFDYVDNVTGKPVYSEGLLQLSYGDIEWAPFCRFDWSKDKYLSSTSPKKTILDPYINLDCGIRILADQIHRKKEIALKSGVYWAVLREGGKYTQISNIAKFTKKLTFCP